ncbi:MAG: DUF1573 domain-containing protein [Bacteroidales bacterium]|nr:DUF1573 domain-containing protein [Bacteroidales bacterium]
MNQGDEGTCVFTFKNTGDAQLIVSDVATSCGCTAASFDDHPVMPQRTGKIEVSYDTSNWGYFTKYIKVTSNSADKRVTILTIKGYVRRDDTGAAGR